MLSPNPATPNHSLPKTRHIAGDERVPIKPAVTPAVTAEKSVIGNDLKISGTDLKIVGRGVLQVDGEVLGDVQAIEVIIGSKGKVTGTVAGQQVTVRGAVAGVVRAKTVSLEASARVEGDVHHMAFAVAQGALFEGRSRRASSEADLQLGAPGESNLDT